MDQVSKRVFKYATHGGVSAVAFKVMTKGLGPNISVRGMNVPTWLYAFAIGASASVGADLVHLALTPYVKFEDAMVRAETAVLIPASAGALYVLAEEVATPELAEELSRKNSFVIGVVAEVVSAYLYKNVVVPAVGASVDDCDGL